MPRAKNIQTVSVLAQLQEFASRALGEVRSAIKAKESDLRRLKEEEAQLVAMTGSDGVATSDVDKRPAGGTTRRTDWSAVLAKLPKQFKASHVRTVRGVGNKRHSEIFAAITRWVEAGTVKRKDRGLYERVR